MAYKHVRPRRRIQEKIGESRFRSVGNAVRTLPSIGAAFFLLWTAAGQCRASAFEITLNDAEGVGGRTAAPVAYALNFGNAQLKDDAQPQEALMLAQKDAGNSQFIIKEGNRLVLRYNYEAVSPGDLLSAIHPDNRKYARARSDYIHPLYGFDGEELTKDWSVDHPHHRGIYWAWPEVDYHGERGDLHALQRVFARPTGQIALRNGPAFAQIDAENLWRWEDQEPIVREQVVIRAYRSDAKGRYVDLEFRFTALKDEVAIARRGMNAYGGLNIRLAAVKDQLILFHTDPADAKPRIAWADLSGTFAGAKNPSGILVLPNAANPDYPGDWIKYPELNWFQPTFPASGTRYKLQKDQPLVLLFRLWIHRGGKLSEELYDDQWRSYQKGHLVR